MRDGTCYGKYEIVSLHQSIEAKAATPGTSVQLAELIALTKTLDLGRNKILNIYTDSK